MLIDLWDAQKRWCTRTGFGECAWLCDTSTVCFSWESDQRLAKRQDGFCFIIYTIITWLCFRSLLCHYQPFACHSYKQVDVDHHLVIVAASFTSRRWSSSCHSCDLPYKSTLIVILSQLWSPLQANVDRHLVTVMIFLTSQCWSSSCHTYDLPYKSTLIVILSQLWSPLQVDVDFYLVTVMILQVDVNRHLVTVMIFLTCPRRSSSCQAPKWLLMNTSFDDHFDEHNFDSFWWTQVLMTILMSTILMASDEHKFRWTFWWTQFWWLLMNTNFDEHFDEHNSDGFL